MEGHTARQIVDRLGISNVNVLYRWKQEQLEKSGAVASSLEAKGKDLEADLRRVERERDILKKRNDCVLESTWLAGGRPG